MKSILGVYGNPDRHWVGDGFPVRTLFSYNSFGPEVSPFLLLDYAGPHEFRPAVTPRGVGQHPHRGFETVTIVYDGSVAHKDSTGQGGVIGPDEVQWMTAAGGILHEEYHSPAFTRTGGMLRMIQLWVNLPAKNKMDPPNYQSIVSKQIPAVLLPDAAGKVRVIAGDFDGHRGPAKTYTPINVWDMRLNAGAEVALDFLEGHTVMFVVLSGSVLINDTESVRDGEMILLDRKGQRATIKSSGDAVVLVLTGEPIDEPIFGHGPFVMNVEAEIHQAFDDFNSGRFGAIVRT